MHNPAQSNADVLCTTILWGLFFAVGLLYMGLAIPLILRRIPPNQLYGWRTPKAFRSKEIWYQINWYCGRDFFAIGFLISAFNLVLLWFSGRLEYVKDVWLIAGNLILLVGGVSLMIVRGLRHLKKL